MAHSYATGDVVIYRTFGGTRRSVLVTDTFDEDGQRGFSGHLLNPEHARQGRKVWGYNDQIEAVEAYQDPHEPQAEEIRQVCRAYELDRDFGTGQDAEMME